MLVSSFSLLALLSVFSTASAQSPEEKSLSPFRRRIVTVGDLHGDYDNTIESLQLGKVADAHGNWIGGNTILVQTGDIFDRYVLCVHVSARSTTDSLFFSAAMTPSKSSSCSTSSASRPSLPAAK